MIDISSYSVSTQLLALYKFGGVTPRLLEALLRHYGHPDTILRADTPSVMQVEGMTGRAARSITSAVERLEEAALLARSLSERDIHVLSRLEKDYPRLLLELNDPPSLLFVRGCLPRGGKRALVLTGAENATGAGIEMASRLAKRFSRKGIQVISSLSGGIDAAAHLGCKSIGAGSFAVVDHGFDHVQDAEKMPLAIDIAESGGIISEYLPDRPPSPQTLAEANRLMVGLSQAVAVVEVYTDSTRTLDLLSFCSEIGKLTFFVVHPKLGALADEESFDQAVKHGAIVIEGYERTDDIIRSLV